MLEALGITAALALALAAAALWWIRRENPAVVPVGRAPRQLRELAPGCDLGVALMAVDVGQEVIAAPKRSGGAASGSGGKPPKRATDKTPTRRSFLRAGLGVSALTAVGGFGGASLAFLWPSLAGGFGAELDVDSEETILASIRDNGKPYEYPAGRLYLTEYDPALDPDGQYADITGGTSVMALYQKCVHLGCRVPFCESAQWFQCPCHGSNYNRWGEYQLGPAPRGLDRFPVRSQDGRIFVNTSPAVLVTGPTRDSGVLRQPQEGPSCT